jgi:hypothetical protein
MYKIRQISYSKASTSIQVYKIENRKRVIVRHIGTARSDKEREDLLALANDFISKATSQVNLFESNVSGNTFYLSQTEFIGVYYTFLYEAICKIFIQIGLDRLRSSLLLDLVVIRLMEPASKLRSIELLHEYFGIKHRRQTYYQSALLWLTLKAKAESIIVGFAKKNYAFDFDILFYDVTTLYFESFTEDELRQNGFSKDNKSQQPQIVVALMVTKEGLPISYEIFSGKTFEGHTIIPSIKALIKKYDVKDFTVVADAAMISAENIELLRQQNINYIVGARLGNLSNQLISSIDKTLTRKDGSSIRLETDKGFLICSFSSTRKRKDNYEMVKQMEKAEYIIKNPAKNKKLKFTQTNGQKIELNKKLIEKTEKLLGVKGYYTNLTESKFDNTTIIQRYHELYRIEQAFRLSKHDLKTRPIFHFKEEPIQLHILICFIALTVAKHIELKTGTTIKNFIHQSKKITDARLVNLITRTEMRIRVKLSPEMTGFLAKLDLLT